VAKSDIVKIVDVTGNCGTTETPLHWVKPVTRFVDLGQTVYDSETQLQWEKKVAGSNDPHGVEETITWCQATGLDGDGACSAPSVSWIARINNQAFAGFSDWRLPTLGELKSIQMPCQPTAGPCVVDSLLEPHFAFYYWSVTETGSNSALASADGNAAVEVGKDTLLAVRAVRGGP
jgi:hypothetical protein